MCCFASYSSLKSEQGGMKSPLTKLVVGEHYLWRRADWQRHLYHMLKSRHIPSKEKTQELNQLSCFVR